MVKKSVVQKVCPTRVNYGMSVEEVVRCGDYDWHHGLDVFAVDKLVGKVKQIVEMHILHFDRKIHSQEVLQEMEDMDLWAAGIHELLSFGVKQPRAQLQFPVLGLGASRKDWHGYTVVPSLSRFGDSKRGIASYEFKSLWEEHFRFAAVPKHTRPVGV